MVFLATGDLTFSVLGYCSNTSVNPKHPDKNIFQKLIAQIKQKKQPSIIWVLLGSVSVCSAPINMFTSLSFKERKVTGLS